MDFCKKNIHSSILKASKYSQLTINDDFNIPDVKEDIDKIIAGCGNAIIEEVCIEDGRIKITGVVEFRAMYKTVGENSDIEVYEGEVPFEDHVNIEGITKNHRAECRCRLEDLIVSMINSRKLEVRGLIGNSINVYEDCQVDGATDLINSQGIECQYKNIILSDMVISKNDVFRIREELQIQDSKPNIKEILWSSVDFRNVETKALDNKLSVRGELEIFVIYKGSEEHQPVQYLFSVRSISKEVECQGAREGMVIETECLVGKGDVSVRQDADGEDRIVAIEYGINMTIKMYEDEEYTLLNDMYSPQSDICPSFTTLEYENLVMRNYAKAKQTYRKRIDVDSGALLQVCHVYGGVDIDDISILDDGVSVKGVIKANVLYIAAGDDPLSCMQIDVPFEHVVDTAPLAAQNSIRIVPSLDMLSASLLNSEEIEIKAQVNLGISIFERNSVNVITDMTVNEIDYKKKAAMPGIVGYIVKKDDTIWSIARKYYATTESIKQINNLDSDNIREGDRLLIVKN